MHLYICCVYVWDICVYIGRYPFLLHVYVHGRELDLCIAQLMHTHDLCIAQVMSKYVYACQWWIVT